MNPVLILTKNCLELTERCVESVLRQNVKTDILVIDNGSTDGTFDWLRKASSEGLVTIASFGVNMGVSHGWNDGLTQLFNWPPFPNDPCAANHALVLNNDVILPPWFYRYLLDYRVEFVTGVAVDSMDAIAEPAPICPLTPHPDFSAFLITRKAWEIVGPFDERMKHYCSDCDWHIRAHRLGLPLWKANVPYFHINSQTMKRASPAERAEIEGQANKDREFFRSQYNCLPGDSTYEALFR